MAYLFKLTSRLIVERHLPTMASDAYGIGLKRPVLPATNTMGALQQFKTEIASLAFGRTHWAHNCVRFSPFKLLSVLPGFVYKRPRLDLVFCCCCYCLSLLYQFDSAQDTCKHT